MSFVGAWEHKFPATKTKPRVFHLSKTKQVTTKTMRFKEHEIKYIHNNEMKIRMGSLPYRSMKENALQMEMLIILPDEIEGLPAFEVS